MFDANPVAATLGDTTVVTARSLAADGNEVTGVAQVGYPPASRLPPIPAEGSTDIPPLGYLWSSFRASAGMEGILAITFIFGGGGLFLLSVSPVGRAFAERIRGGTARDDELVRELQDAVHELLEDNRAMREELTEVQERVDFAERLLASGREEHN